MEKPKLLIADPSEDFRNALVQAFRGAYTVRATAEGEQALNLIQNFQPDILLLDLMLSGIDGITLLQRSAELGIYPKTLAITRYLSDYMLEAAQRLGVGYIMVKPCDISAVIARVTDLTQALVLPPATHADPKSSVTNLLLRLGIPTKLRGYGYLREAIVLMARKPDQSITKELYPTVASMCAATAVQVERSIRSAITTAWSRRDSQTWQLYFPGEGLPCANRPTNATFICQLADSVRSDTL